jgi:hypothetical protein
MDHRGYLFSPIAALELMLHRSCRVIHQPRPSHHLGGHYFAADEKLALAAVLTRTIDEDRYPLPPASAFVARGAIPYPGPCTLPIESDRYPLSPRIRTLRAILAKLSPEPAREPPPPPKVFAPPKGTAARRRRAGR